MSHIWCGEWSDVLCMCAWMYMRHYTWHIYIHSYWNEKLRRTLFLPQRTGASRQSAGRKQITEWLRDEMQRQTRPRWVRWNYTARALEKGKAWEKSSKNWWITDRHLESSRFQAHFYKTVSFLSCFPCPHWQTLATDPRMACVMCLHSLTLTLQCSAFNLCRVVKHYMTTRVCPSCAIWKLFYTSVGEQLPLHLTRGAVHFLSSYSWFTTTPLIMINKIKLRVNLSEILIKRKSSKFLWYGHSQQIISGHPVLTG